MGGNPVRMADDVIVCVARLRVNTPLTQPPSSPQRLMRAAK